MRTACACVRASECKGVATPRRESREAGMCDCSLHARASERTFFLFPSKIDGTAAGRRVFLALIYKRRGITLPIIKHYLAVRHFAKSFANHAKNSLCIMVFAYITRIEGMAEKFKKNDLSASSII